MEVLMRKITFLSLVLILMISSSVHALSWAISFVVLKGNVYEVKQEEMIEESEIGKVIGEVKTTPDDMTGEYYGDASNFYPKGTKYYAIKGIPTSKAIAIKNDNQYLKAVYVHKAPFHIMNVLTNIYFLTAVGIVALLIIRARFRFKKTNS
jgi:hypothetical protein